MPNSAVDVSAGAPNLEQYTVNGDGTVTDNVTGLMWQQTAPTTAYAWADAIAYCPTLTLGGDSDWRLPSVLELVSIADFGQTGFLLNAAFTPPSLNYFWSSTLGAGAPGQAWYVVFTNGGGPGRVTATRAVDVRCVR